MHRCLICGDFDAIEVKIIDKKTGKPVKTVKESTAYCRRHLEEIKRKYQNKYTIIEKEKKREERPRWSFL